jgi:hypothetical protein
MWLGCIATAQILPVLDFLTGTLTILYHAMILSELGGVGQDENICSASLTQVHARFLIILY